MAVTPGVFKVFKARVVSAEGNCSAGHKQGDTFEISCWNPSGLCGFFYHDIFPTLQTYQFGGKLPWGGEETLTLECPDRHNLITLEVDLA
jgi:uncharacterized repeat protein (TIGR04076 family)